MNKKIIFLVFIIMLLGLGVWFYSFKSEDVVIIIFEDLKEETEINFSEVQDCKIKWFLEKEEGVEERKADGKKMKASMVSEESPDKIIDFLEKNGFEMSPHNVADGTVAGLVGYRKKDIVCTLASGVTGYQEADIGWNPEDYKTLDFVLSCGILE